MTDNLSFVSLRRQIKRLIIVNDFLIEMIITQTKFTTYNKSTISQLLSLLFLCFFSLVFSQKAFYVSGDAFVSGNEAVYVDADVQVSESINAISINKIALFTYKNNNANNQSVQIIDLEKNRISEKMKQIVQKLLRKRILSNDFSQNSFEKTSVYRNSFAISTVFTFYKYALVNQTIFELFNSEFIGFSPTSKIHFQSKFNSIFYQLYFFSLPPPLA